MTYALLQGLHLLAAIAFAGTVFFEVVMLEAVRKRLPPATAIKVEQALGARAVRIMPWFLLLLYGAGVGMAWSYRGVLLQPWGSGFALLLSLKMALALSVLGHFFTAMYWRRRGVLSGLRSRRLHISIFCHVLLIVVLAKAMFHVGV